MNLDANDLESLLRPLRMAAQATRDAVSPTRDAMSPTRDAMLPTRDAMLPTPDAMTPTRDAMLPTPDAMTPTRDAMSPTPDALPSAPAAMSSTRRALSPTLEALSSSGEGPLEAALSLTRAERELERVLRADHARWLARAAMLRASRMPLAGHFGIARLGRGALRALHAHWIELAATTRACGLSLPRTLRACASDDVAVWPSAVRLARAAVELEPCSETRRVLVVCLRAEGWIDLAQALEADLDRARGAAVDRSHASATLPVLDNVARRTVDVEDVDCGGCI